MVSWDMKVKFYGLSPNVKELVKLAKKQGFSNIESLEDLGDGLYRLVVNDRGLKQFEEIGFWNMECVKISETKQLRKLKETV